ncbi:MAG: hypothetical protein L0170_03085 [Acidobacteria bacterium]|nr:hypothetical protein [Acidobacteriota bacterium]
MKVTTRDSLHALIDRLSDEEVEDLSERLEQEDWDSTAEEELDPEQMAGVLEGRAQNERGESVSGDELFRRLRL